MIARKIFVIAGGLVQILRNQNVRLQIKKNFARRIAIAMVHRHQDHKIDVINGMNVVGLNGHCLFEASNKTPARYQLVNLSNVAPAHAAILNMSSSDTIVNLVFKVCSDDERGKHCVRMDVLLIRYISYFPYSVMVE